AACGLLAWSRSAPRWSKPEATNGESVPKLEPRVRGEDSGVAVVSPRKLATIAVLGTVLPSPILHRFARCQARHQGREPGRDAVIEGFDMAFNPFTSFRKYQRFWMATVLLLCMITFVLCTGVGGDLSQRLLELFRKQEGSPLARVDGHNVFNKELTDLREQRNMANEFLKRCLEVC